MESSFGFIVAIVCCLSSGVVHGESGVERVPLAGPWRAIADKDKTGEQQSFQTTALVPAGWNEVVVPCTFGALGKDFETFVGTCWFRRSCAVPAAWRGKRVALHFDGIANQAKVWINGQLVGEALHPYLPCDMRADDALRYGEENVIAVAVNSEHPHCGVPTNFYWRSDGGILRNVELRATDYLFLENVKIEATPAASGAGAFLLRARIGNERSSTATTSIRVRVLDARRAERCVLNSEPIRICEHAIGEGEIRAELRDVTPWSPEAPVLYAAVIEMLEAGNVVASREVRFGFRNVEVRGVQVLLNGKPLYMFGFNRHEDTFRDGMALDLQTVERDLRDIKRMGANFVRLCHYPHDTATLDWCDELGLLVMCEIPFLGCSLDRRGPENRPTETRLVAESTREQLTRLIRRDWNHPSVIFWSTGNENDENDPAIRGIHADLARLAKGLDPTRLVTHVSVQGNWGNSSFDSHEYDDVAGANAYGYMNYGDDADAKFFKPAFDFYEQHRCTKPLFITEYGNWDLKDRNPPGVVSGAKQVATLNCDPRYFQRPFICGSLIWLYADHTWPVGSSFFGITDGISPFGLYTRERKPGEGVKTAEALFKQLGELDRKRQAESPQ